MGLACFGVHYTAVAACECYQTVAVSCKRQALNMIEFLLMLALLPITLPAASLLVLTLAALRPARADDAAPAVADSPALRVAVLVPAHNESVNLIPTIECLQRQLGAQDRLLVVADNCSDDTAEVARRAGALVVERHDAELRGKGYALAFGVEQLRADPPDVVLVVDADCTVSDGAVACIAQRCQSTGKPMQMLYLLSAGSKPGLKLRVLQFAMLMKNLVRPLGALRLGGACHLMGTGMAIPWRLMSSAKLATGHITEDMKLGIEMAMVGAAPQFLPDLLVSSVFPLDTDAAKVQKTRWEHGHLATLTEDLPGLLLSALKTRNPALIVMAMDLLIPPVAFYFLLLFGVLAVLVVATVFWPVWALAAWLLAIAALCFGLAIGLAWFRYGRDLLSARELLSTPLYALWKLPIYVAYLLKKRSGWVRTKRDSE